MMRKTRKVGDPGIEQELRAAEGDSRFVQLELRDADPDSPSDGLAWIVRGTPPTLRVMIDGVVRSVSLT